jgi:hypothetical protein
MMCRPPRNRSRCLALFALVLLGAAPVARAAAAAHRKPEMPVAFTLRLIGPPASGQVRFEARVDAVRPVQDIQVEVRTPRVAGATAIRPQQLGRMAAGDRRALSFQASIPATGHSEIVARVSFRSASGTLLSSGAYLAFDDGHPSRPVEPRPSPAWRGSPVVEYPAAGGGR